MLCTSKVRAHYPTCGFLITPDRSNSCESMDSIPIKPVVKLGEPFQVSLEGLKQLVCPLFKIAACIHINGSSKVYVLSMLEKNGIFRRSRM